MTTKLTMTDMDADIGFSFERLPPELKVEVINYLADDLGSLFCTTLANREWHGLSIDLLWRRPFALGLARLLPERRQYFASMVNEINIYRSSSCAALEELEFHCLRRVYISDTMKPKIRLRPYLQPTLTSLKIDLHPLTLDTLNLIQLHCPGLQELRLWRCVKNIHPKAFARFLQSLPCLRFFAVESENSDWIMQEVITRLHDDIPQRLEGSSIEGALAGIEPKLFQRFVQGLRSLRVLELVSERYAPLDDQNQLLISSELLAYFADHRKLRRLQLHRWLTHDFVEQSLRQVSAQVPFQDIQDLRLWGDSRAIKPFLLASPKSLTVLKLDVDDVDGNICALISHCTNLVDLSLTFTENKELCCEELQQLICLERLECLSIESDEHDLFPPLSIPGLTDDGFGQWISHFPLLRQLSLGWNGSELTPAIFEHISKACPLIHSLGIQWVQDLSDWLKLRAPLFMKLESLRLNDLVPFDDGDEDEVARSASLSAHKALSGKLLTQRSMIGCEFMAKGYAEMILKLAPALQIIGVTPTHFTHSADALDLEVDRQIHARGRDPFWAFGEAR